MFPCQCGHGFLRKVEEVDTTTARKKKPKAEKEKPKLNVNAKLVSQKGLGEYFTENTRTTRKPVCPSSQETTATREPPKVIPGLNFEAQPKSQRLNMDLSAKIVENKGQAAGETSENVTPGTVDVDILETQSEEEIFLSEEEEEDEDLCSQTLILTEGSDNVEELEANVKLREENVRLKENILAERRLNVKYQEQLMTENKVLKARVALLQQQNIEDQDGSLIRLKSDLEEKDVELGLNIETIQELNKLLQQERNNSSVLRSLIAEDITVKSSVETGGRGNNNNNIPS